VVQVARLMDDEPGPWRERVDALERGGKLDGKLATSLRDLEPRLAPGAGQKIRVAELGTGMRFIEPLRAREGTVLVPRGVPVNALLLARLSGADVTGEAVVAFDLESTPTPLPFPASA
jgi:hypothetical protein